MTVSKPVTQWAHTALIGFITGVLSYLSSFLVGAPMPAPRAILLAVLISGFSRMAGALLGKLNTPGGG
jgi:hypothetical protein